MSKNNMIFNIMVKLEGEDDMKHKHSKIGEYGIKWEPVEDYKKGKENALQFLIGQVMAATRGKAKPEIVSEILRKVL